MNANKKGKRAEREVANMLNQFFDANVRRTPQSGGMSIKGDIIDTQGILSEFHFEVKNQERLNIWKALDQAQADCPSRREPVVVFTKNHKPYYACMHFDDWMDLVKELEDLRAKTKGQ